MKNENEVAERQVSQTIQTTVYPILFAISAAHLLNDLIQQAIPMMYPVFKKTLNLSYTEIGLITFVLNLTASFLQPIIGLYTDVKPKPYSLPLGMCFTLVGIICLAYAANFYLILVSVCIVGIGSAVLHPESSRVAYMASGGSKKRGLAQSIFQIGGNTGSAIAPLIVAWLIVPEGQRGIIYLTVFAIAAIIIQSRVSIWYKNYLSSRSTKKAVASDTHNLSRNKVIGALAILIVLIFSKFVYVSSITSYYTFYLKSTFDLTVEQSQFYLFIFLVSMAVGTFLGGPISDRFNRKHVIWFSILGTAPFALLLPHANLFWSGVLCVLVGLILSSAFSVILVYAQELMPGKIGMVSGLFFGLAFGMGGIGSAILGYVADKTSIDFAFRIASVLPLLGLVAGFLPNLKKMYRV
ncbi:MAG: MFS transporter [Cytophaga sp.]|uniref:MFS transporter n=1 Tax=Cytophaga sp. TaxID=29535 RepID=UPI003F7D0F43